jgi:hypothetical protein
MHLTAFFEIRPRFLRKKAFQNVKGAPGNQRAFFNLIDPDYSAIAA